MSTQRTITVEAALVKNLAEVVGDFIEYSRAMRKIGRGTSTTEAEHVLAATLAVLAKA